MIQRYLPLLSAILCLLSAMMPAHADVTVWVKSANAPYVYAWDSDGNELLGAYPGTALTVQDNVAGWWLCLLPDVSSANIIINNGGDGWGNKTSDITGLTGTRYFDYDGDGDCGTATDVTGSAGYTFPTGVVINDENFPDAAFRQCLKNMGTLGMVIDGGYRYGGNPSIKVVCYAAADPGDNMFDYNVGLKAAASDNLLTKTEINKLSYLAIHTLCSSNVSNITDLTGLKHFTNLKHLLLAGAAVESVDLSQNPTLLRFSIRSMPNLTSLTGLSALEDLVTISMTGTSVSELDVSANSKLTWLNVSSNKLARLDLSNNPELVTLTCDGNELMTLDVSANTKLQVMHCEENHLTELNLDKNTALETYRVDYGPMGGDAAYHEARIWSVNYTDQVRDITAEVARVPVMENGQVKKGDDGKPVMQFLYYFRLPGSKGGDEQYLSARMTEGNYAAGDQAESTFDYDRSSGWTGATFYQGTYGSPSAPRRAADTGTIVPAEVLGDILILSPTDEDTATGEASGTVTYYYDAEFSGTVNSGASDPTGLFTLNWHTAPNVITGVDGLAAELPSVEDVVLYDLQGRSGDKPFKGVNIIVTRYSDGSTRSFKSVY